MKQNHFMSLAIAMAGLFWSCETDWSINDPENLVPKTAEQDASIPSIKINNAQIHAEAFGPVNGPLLIILHGGRGSDYRYLLKCKAFADQGYPVVFYDQPGAGLSQRFPKSIYTMQILYDDLSGVITHFKTSPSKKYFYGVIHGEPC